MRLQLLLIALAISCLSYSANGQKIKLVKDIIPGLMGSNPEILGAFKNGNIIFRADSTGIGSELWISDGTGAGTKRLVTAPNSGDGVTFSHSIFVNEKLYFVGYDDVHGRELWTSNGTTAGTKIIVDLYPLFGNGITNAAIKPSNMVYHNGYVYFTATDGRNATTVFKTDGTANGTVRIKNAGAWNNFYTVALGKIFVAGTTITNGQELYVTDGTDVGTKRVDDLHPSIYDGFANEHSVLYDNQLIFQGRKADATGLEPYITDGNSVSILKNIHSIPDSSSNPKYFRVVGNTMFFVAYTNSHGRELYATNSNGTLRMKDIMLGSGSSDPHFMGELNGKLIFAAKSSAHGNELYISDGTSAGTKLLKDINKYGDGVSNILSEEYNRDKVLSVNNVYNGILYFAANDSTHGIELWQTDGTDTGTRMVEDFANGRGNRIHIGASIKYIFVDSNNVWLSISNGPGSSGSGNELHLYKAPVPIPQSINNVSVKNVSMIYPNPNSGAFTISTNNYQFKHGKVQVFDVLGRLIYNQNISSSANSFSIQLPNTTTGIYTVRLLLDKHVETHIINIQK